MLAEVSQHSGDVRLMDSIASVSDGRPTPPLFSEVVERTQTVLDRRNGANVLPRNPNVEFARYRAFEHEYAPIRFEARIGDLIENNSGYIIAAVAIANLYQYREFEVFSGKEQPGHGKRSPAGCLRQQHKSDFAVLQAESEELFASHLLQHRPIGAKIARGLLLGWKAGRQRAGDAMVAIRDFERLALPVASRRLAPTYPTINHLGYPAGP